MSLSKISSTAANILFDSSDIYDNDAIDETNSNFSTDSDNTEENLGTSNDLRELNDNDLPTFSVRMLNLCREIVIICLLMITYAALTKDPPKISKAPAAYPFFFKNSLITDWFRGEISKAIEQARSSDIAFVMFYAPWDAESQAARGEFEATARHMSNYVTFVAVNCWQPNSECRNQYNKVYRWPVLIAYPSHGRGVQYNGPISAAHMIQFLQKICNPFMRFSEEIPLEYDDAYLVANVDTSPGSLDFAVLYTTALKYLEKDPLQSISFFVQPTKGSHPLLYFFLWNETLIYSSQEEDWRPDEILQWLFKSFHQVTAWMAPIGSKSLILANTIQEGPSLILFTPKNPLRRVTDYYKMLQEVAYKYHTCEDNLSINLQTMNIKLLRSVHMLQYNTLKAQCISEDVSKWKITSHLHDKWSNISQCNQKQANNNHCILEDSKLSVFGPKMLPEKCIEFIPVQPEYLGKPCNQKIEGTYKTSMLTGENDVKSPWNLLKLWNKEMCRNFLYIERLQPPFFETFIEKEKKDHNISGLACRTNKSLTFVAMDSLLFYHFAERLGIDVSKSKDRSTVTIINEKMESHYTWQGSVNTQTLSEFIQNFTQNKLVRSQNSVTTLQKSRIVESNSKKRKLENAENVIIKEINSISFSPTILQENKAVVVFYYSKQCSFCSGISYIFLTVAKKLSMVKNLIFTRIDGESNILPWEYTMDSYPTILFIPTQDVTSIFNSKTEFQIKMEHDINTFKLQLGYILQVANYGKAESRVFPANIPVTVPNLVGFILTNLDSGRKLDAMWSICNKIKLKEEKFTCYTLLQAETLEMIDRTLRNWGRSNKRQKQVLLRRLRHLRQLHFLFAHAPQKQRLIEDSLEKLKSSTNHSREYRLKDEL